MRHRLFEHGGERRHERLIGRVIRPKCKDPAGTQMPRRGVPALSGGRARRGAGAAVFAANDRYRPARHRSGGPARRDRSPAPIVVIAKKSAWTRRQRLICGELSPERQQPCACHSITSAKASTTISDPTASWFRAPPARCSRARARRRRRRARPAPGGVGRRETKPRQFDFGPVNRLDIRNSSPSLISKMSMPVESCRRRLRLSTPIGVGRKSSSSKFTLIGPLPDGGALQAPLAAASRLLRPPSPAPARLPSPGRTE